MWSLFWLSGFFLSSLSYFLAGSKGHEAAAMFPASGSFCLYLSNLGEKLKRSEGAGAEVSPDDPHRRIRGRVKA